MCVIMVVAELIYSSRSKYCIFFYVRALSLSLSLSFFGACIFCTDPEKIERDPYANPAMFGYGFALSFHSIFPIFLACHNFRCFNRDFSQDHGFQLFRNSDYEC